MPQEDIPELGFLARSLRVVPTHPVRAGGRRLVVSLRLLEVSTITPGAYGH